MFERFTESARRALFFARYDCSELGAPAIDTEHLLLGVMREAGGLTDQILARAGVKPMAVRQDILRKSEARARIPTSVELRFSEAARRALQAAVEEANRLKHVHIGTEHLLLGLLLVDDSMAAATLREHGLTVETARVDLAALIQLAESPTAMNVGATLDRINEDVGELEMLLDGTDPERQMIVAAMVARIQEQIQALKRFLDNR